MVWYLLFGGTESTDQFHPYFPCRKWWHSSNPMHKWHHNHSCATTTATVQAQNAHTVLGKMQNPGSHNGPLMVNGWVVGLSSGCSVNQWSAQTMKSIKMVKRRQSESEFYLGTSTNGHMICSASVESYVQFDTEIFSAKPKEFIGRQTDHRWWDLGSPGVFTGRIWWPGDPIAAALHTLQLMDFLNENGLNVSCKWFKCIIKEIYFIPDRSTEWSKNSQPKGGTWPGSVSSMPFDNHEP